MREKEPIASNTDYGKDEDSAEALLKKHEAFMSDLEAYRTVIEGLRDQAQSCNVSFVVFCSIVKELKQNMLIEGLSIFTEIKPSLVM